MRRILRFLLACVLFSTSAFAQKTADPLADMAIPDQPAEVTASNREGSTDDAAPENPLDQPVMTVAPANTPPVIKVPGTEMTLFPLKHADASAIKEIFNQLGFQAEMSIVVDNRLNALLITADAANTQTVESLLKILDAPEVAQPANQTSRSESRFGGGRGESGGASPRSRDRSTAATRPPLKPRFNTSTNASIEELREAYTHYDQQAKQAAANVRASDKPGHTAMLRVSVKRAFEIRQQLQRAELAEFEKRLDSIRQSIETRDRIAEQIIDRRVEELLDPNLKWDTGEVVTAASSDAEMPAVNLATNIKDTRFGDPQQGLRMALVSARKTPLATEFSTSHLS